MRGGGGAQVLAGPMPETRGLAEALQVALVDVEVVDAEHEL